MLFCIDIFIAFSVFAVQKITRKNILLKNANFINFHAVFFCCRFSTRLFSLCRPRYLPNKQISLPNKKKRVFQRNIDESVSIENWQFLRRIIVLWMLVLLNTQSGWGYFEFNLVLCLLLVSRLQYSRGLHRAEGNCDTYIVCAKSFFRSRPLLFCFRVLTPKRL